MNEMEKKEIFLKESEKVLKKLKGESGIALIIHHDDADGICSGAIAAKMLEMLGLKYHVVCVEKVFPEVIKLIDETKVDFFVFTDIGSGAASKISKMITGDRSIYIMDHHDAERVEDPRLTHFNPELFGLSGEVIASGATVTYLVARNLGEDAKKLAWMAVVGAAEIPGRLDHFNWLAFQDAQEVGDVERTVTPRGESIRVKVFRKPISYKSLNTSLTILGSVGYYRDGPQLALSACFFRDLSEAEKEIKKLEKERKEKFDKVMERIKEDGLFALRNVQWFDVEDEFKNMGTKTIGTFTSKLRFKLRLIHGKKYILGFMNMSNIIPGLGEIKGRWKKVSVRVPFKFEELIHAGSKQPVSALIVAAAYHNGGYGDGHDIAGSGVVPYENKQSFIEMFESLAAEKPK
ncbi:hypothetical protein DRN86_00260 [Candidatus Geothermarchaeota archaeon]|nr:MAG: hypothetical protein DRN86_00260 [Candidatus Geothermarchaeota archaeon]